MNFGGTGFSKPQQCSTSGNSGPPRAAGVHDEVSWLMDYNVMSINCANIAIMMLTMLT